MKLQEVKQKIIEANPEIEVRNTSVKIPEPFSGLINYRDTTIRLADVLLAIRKHYTITFSVNALGEFEQRMFINNAWIIKSVSNWNLSKDSLDEQSEETISFLWEILK